NHRLVFSINAERVFSFEPLPEVFQLLEKNVRQNKVKNILPINVALSDVNEEQFMYLSLNGNVGGSSFDNHGGNSKRTKVICQRGDDWVASHAVDKIDFIKIDVEGHESFVLEGLQETLLQQRPIIMLEWAEKEGVDRLKKSSVFNQLLTSYSVCVLGTNHDKSYRANNFIGKLQRKIVKNIVRKRSVLYPFDSNELYNNILLVPNERKELIF
ncbi:MAG: FkbM family methyltransferase, partial [Cellvibrionales bacterium]|nr:FkbM family methyltransferase [Cellvibrionales bacterium]